MQTSSECCRKVQMLLLSRVLLSCLALSYLAHSRTLIAAKHPKRCVSWQCNTVVWSCVWNSKANFQFTKRLCNFPQGQKVCYRHRQQKKIPSHFPNPRTPESQVVLHSWSRQVLGREEDSTSPAAAGNNQFTNNLETLFCPGVANFFSPHHAVLLLNY